MKEKENVTPELAPEQLEAMVAKARAGDQDAYTALYAATSQEVYRTVRSMVRTEDQALDIQQDAYVFAFTHLDQLEEPSSLRSWLRSIAVNRARSVLRKQTPVLFSELETDEGAGLPEVADCSPAASPELSLERKETSALVNEILDGLTVGQRAVVGMYYYEQMPVGQIADDLGVSPGTVKTQLYRGRRKIETAVKRLEARGVKLFGLAPVPFLLALLKKQTPAAEAGKTVLNGALTKSGVAPVAETAALHVGRRFFQTAAGRILLGLMVAGAVGGGIAGYNWYQERLNIGDFQPPTTVEMELDSDEDLSVETQDETAEPETLPDTPEDLTEPETAEPTEPETTEPTEPETTEPTDPEETTDPVGADDPTNPSNPQDPTAPAGSDAPIGPSTPPDPTDPEPAELTEATEEPTTEPTEEPTTEPTESSTLPTTPPFPPSPGNVTIALGETWTYTGTGDASVRLVFYALRSRYDHYDSTAIIGVQEDGHAALSFCPEETGIFKIYYHAANSENMIYWATINVTGGTEG